MNMTTGYYVKETTENGGEIRIPITEDNVFARCPQCGKEHWISNFIAVVQGDEDFDLYGTQTYCESCSLKLFKNARKRSRGHVLQKTKERRKLFQQLATLKRKSDRNPL